MTVVIQRALSMDNKYIPIKTAITIMYQLLSRFMTLNNDKNTQLATEYIKLELKRFGVLDEDTQETTSNVTEALAAMAVATNPYDILFIYEDIQEKVNALFRAKWESLDTHESEVK